MLRTPRPARPQPIFALCLAAAVVPGGAVGSPPPGQPDAHLAAMEREHAADHPAPSPATAPEPAGEVVTEEVGYGAVDGDPVSGYLARPAGEGPWPGLIVIHEWWGLNDNVRAMARRLAGEGYAALAVDLYGGEVAGGRQDAARLAGAARDAPERARANLAAAHEYLVEALDAPAVGTIGWCFGGGWSLDTGIALGEAVDAVVIYYGRLVTDPAELEPLVAPVLGIFGAEDEGIPPSTVRAFEAALEAAGKEGSIHIYEGADHAFANPSGTRYREEAAEDAWERTIAFLDAHLKAD